MMSPSLTIKFFIYSFNFHYSDDLYTTYKKKKVAEHIVVGYPSPTLNQIFFISKAILSWLNSDKDNIALVHCQESKGRSAVLLSCLMCLMRKYNNPVEALTYFCQVDFGLIFLLFFFRKIYRKPTPARTPFFSLLICST